MTNKEIIGYCLDALKKNGAEKAQCSLYESAKHELNVDAGAMSLFRTTFNTSVTLTALVDKRKGTSVINKTDKESLDAAVAQALDFARSSNQDDANDIADKQPEKHFSSGSDKPDVEKMYARLQEFVDYTKKTYPITNLEQIVFDFTHVNGIFANSNGVSFTLTDGIYNFNAMFTSKDGEKMSSFNGTGGSHRDLSIPLKDWSGADRLMKESSEQIVMKPIHDKFTGDVIITPFAMGDFIGALEAVYLGDQCHITKTSPYRDKLGTVVAAPIFSLHSRPVSGEIEDGYYYTPDGYEAKNSTIVENGVLKSFLISLYGSKKTGLERSVNAGGAYVVDPGKESLETIIRSVKKGIILGRFSGGRPNENGDFSGVAKNSYYIEDGKIQYPIFETMIAGNIGEVFRNIQSLSSERINFGSAILPWVKASGIIISG